jgi:hypothetical protein
VTTPLADAWGYWKPGPWTPTLADIEARLRHSAAYYGRQAARPSDTMRDCEFLLAELRALRAAAQAVIDRVDANLDGRPWPTKYCAPFGELAALAEALKRTAEA